MNKTLVIASHNQGKVKEIAELLQPFNFEVKAASDFGLEPPEETEDSFIGNAQLKAKATATAIGHLALADDSGLVVPALNGQPGIYSARWAGDGRDFNQAMARVAHELQGKDDWSAYFICALSLAYPDGQTKDVEGRIDGTLVWPQRGTKGFGYDPMFVPNGYTQTFGEMDPDQKHRISHRYLAFEQLIDYFKKL